MRGGLAGRVIRVCSGQQQAGSTKTAGRQRTGECKCKNRHVGNQGDSWATHWQRSTAAAWRESHQDTEPSSAQAPFRAVLPTHRTGPGTRRFVHGRRPAASSSHTCEKSGGQQAKAASVVRCLHIHLAKRHAGAFSLGQSVSLL